MKILKKFGKLFKAKKNTDKVSTIENIAIFGYADSPEKDPLYISVVRVSEALAKAGYTVINGGGPGVMKAASVGAKMGDGKVIGVTLYPKDMTDFEGRDPTNMLDVEIKTQNYLERTLTLMKEGQVYVVFNGGTGTLSEFAMAWGLARLYFGHHKPIILYGKFWKKVIKTMSENLLLRKGDLSVLKIVETPEEVLEAIQEFEKEIQHGDHHHMKTTKGDFTL